MIRLLMALLLLPTLAFGGGFVCQDGVSTSKATCEAQTCGSDPCVWYLEMDEDTDGEIDEDILDSGLARDTEVSQGFSNHTAAADPHTGYMLESNIGTGANNYVQLDAGGALPAIDGSNLIGITTGENNDLETDGMQGVLSGEIVIGDGAGSGAYVTPSGDATISTLGVVNVTSSENVDDADYGDVTVSGGAWEVENNSHDHTTTISGKAANVSDADLGDVTISAGSWAVEDDSHDHAVTISGKAANVSDADFGDVNVATGIWNIENDSHDHTTASLPHILEDIVPTCATNEIPKFNGTLFECQADSTGGTPTFDSVGTGTNVTADMTVGTGATLIYSGSGVINANQFQGVTTVDATEFGYLNGVTSAIQTQMDTKYDAASDVDHDATTNFVANEHIDWSAGSAGTIDTTNIAADSLDDTHIDWGTGANQVSAADVPIADAGGYTTETDLEGFTQELASTQATKTTGVAGVVADSLTCFDGTTGYQLKECDSAIAISSIDLGSGTLEIPNSTTLPATCSVGEVYQDTDATSGQRLYLCESANSWVLQGDGGNTNLTDFTDQTAWRLFYSDSLGDVTELALGASGTVLQSNGAALAPTFETVSGSGDVSKVGTPVDGQVGVWTGDGTLAGYDKFKFDDASAGITIYDEGATSGRGINVEEYSNNTSSSFLYYRKARGTQSSPLAVVSGDAVGNFYGQGWDVDGASPTGEWITSAGIRFVVDGAVSNDTVPMGISFLTGTSPPLTSRLDIGSDGNITISGLSGTGSRAVCADSNGLLSDSGCASAGTTLAGLTDTDIDDSNALSDAQVLTYYSGLGWLNVTMSGDATITNTGVVSVGNDTHSHTATTLTTNSGNASEILISDGSGGISTSTGFAFDDTNKSFKLNLGNSSASDRGINVYNTADGGAGPNVNFFKSRETATPGSQDVVDNDNLGIFDFWAYDEGTTSHYLSARLSAEATATATSTAQPAKFRFRLDDSSGSFRDRLTVEPTGQTTIGQSGVSGSCLMIQDYDGGGWTECTTTDGSMSCSVDADGVCDGA